MLICSIVFSAVCHCLVGTAGNQIFSSHIWSARFLSSLPATATQSFLPQHLSVCFASLIIPCFLRRSVGHSTSRWAVLHYIRNYFDERVVMELACSEQSAFLSITIDVAWRLLDASTSSASITVFPIALRNALFSIVLENSIAPSYEIVVSFFLWSMVCSQQCFRGLVSAEHIHCMRVR